VLALMARGGDRGVTRAKLLAMLWPDAHDEQGRRVLSQALYALRRDLGRDEVIVGAQELRLNTQEVWCDAAEFDACLSKGDVANAATLYVGPFLDGFRLASAPEFERWADDERAAIRHRFHEAVEQLARAAESEGAFNDAVKWWRRRAADDPLNARVAVAMMRALAAAGDRNGALRQARIFEALIAQELELAPDRAVVELADALRREAYSTTRVERPCIAVLPFATFGDANTTAQQEWVDGLAEECINELAHQPELRVAARSASLPFGPSPVLSTLAAELGATHALEGSLRFGPRHIRATARLIEVASGHTIWLGRYDCDCADTHAQHDAIAVKVSAAVSALLLPAVSA
jgi:DNA-binding SARP family transcriptional activator